MGFSGGNTTQCQQCTCFRPHHPFLLLTMCFQTPPHIFEPHHLFWHDSTFWPPSPPVFGDKNFATLPTTTTLPCHHQTTTMSPGHPTTSPTIQWRQGGHDNDNDAGWPPLTKGCFHVHRLSGATMQPPPRRGCPLGGFFFCFHRLWYRKQQPPFRGGDFKYIFFTIIIF